MAQPDTRTGGAQQIVQQRQTRFGNEFWRTPSKVVAYIDIVLSGLQIVVLAAYLIMLAVSGRTIVLQSGDFKTKKGKLSLMLVMFVLFHVLFDLVKVWFGTQLLSATELTTPAPEAARKGRRWRNFKFFFLFLDGIVLVVTTGGSLSTTWSVLWLFYKIIAIFIGHEFIAELDEQTPSDDQ